VAEQRAERAERERESAARVAGGEERARIARELHDVVAHAVSVMVLQVGAVRHRMTDDHREDREALRNVEKAGRTALAEMRHLLDALRREDEQSPAGPAARPRTRSASCFDDVRDAGLDARLDVEGDPVDLAAGLDLSAYRIIQEGLTNALKHADAEHAGSRSPTERTTSSSRSVTTVEVPPPLPVWATGWSGSASGSRSSAVT
jgi:signal transduction histidine kinase